MGNARVLFTALAIAALAAGCEPTDRRAEATPSPTASGTPTETATPTPSPTPDRTATPEFVNAFVRVVGSAGTPFTGQILDASGSRTIDGVVPEDFVLINPQTFISFIVSKTQEGLETVTAQIYVNNELVGEQSTSTEFGSVTVNASLP